MVGTAHRGIRLQSVVFLVVIFSSHFILVVIVSPAIFSTVITAIPGIFHMDCGKGWQQNLRQQEDGDVPPAFRYAVLNISSTAAAASSNVLYCTSLGLAAYTLSM